LRLIPLIFGFAIILATAPVRASELADSIVDQLAHYGYQSIEINRTFLGRIRITGEKEDTTREIVLNPRTGIILRDSAVRTSGKIFYLSNENSPSVPESPIGPSNSGVAEDDDHSHDDDADSEDSEDGGEEDEEDEENEVDEEDEEEEDEEEDEEDEDENPH